MLRSGRPAPPPQPHARAPVAPSFTVGRRTDNELILFDEARQESWIVYPPRSVYAFLVARRPGPGVVVVEHHPWQPYAEPEDHQVDAGTACQRHGLDCAAHAAIEAAVRAGYDPFA